MLAQARTELGETTVQWAIEAATTLLDALYRDVVAVGGAPTTTRGLETELLVLLLQLRERRDVEKLEVAEAAQADARTLARGGAPVMVLTETVWRLHATVQDAMLATADTASGPSDRTDNLSQFGDDLHRLARYGQLAARVLTAAHQAEADEWTDTRHARQRAMVDLLIDGQTVNSEQGEALGVRLEGHHLVAAVTDMGQAVNPDDTRLTQLTKAVADTLPSWRLLALTRRSETFLWWSGTRPPTAEQLRILRAIRVPRGLTVGVGDPHVGQDGVARGYLEARRAADVASMGSTRRLCLHQDVLLVAAVLANPVFARQLVARELSGVLGQDDRSSELRETLLLFLRSGGSRKTVAEKLKVAPTTVAYRIERFRTLRGGELDTSRLETWVALDLVDKVPSLLSDLPEEPISHSVAAQFSGSAE